MFYPNPSPARSSLVSRFCPWAAAALTIVLVANASQAGITIGAGPAIGTDKRGTTWYQEFQDWTAGDLRALDRNDNEYKFNNACDTSRDLIAFYSREEGDNYYFRADFFDLLSGAENGNVDLYVAIDCAAGGKAYMPDSMDTNTDHPWEICIKLYDANNAVIEDKNGANVTAGNWLGSYWRSDLDSVEFGIKKSLLQSYGWTPGTPINMQVFTARDSTVIASGSNIVDAFGTLTRDDGSHSTGFLAGAIISTDTTGRAKYAVIAHANQSLAPRGGTQKHIFTNRSDINPPMYPGFIRMIDTHTMLNVPLNMHLSGALLSSLLWARQGPTEAGYPERDGPTFVNRLKTFVSSGKGSIIGGVYAEHIMPYFEGAVNQSSISAFNDLAQEIFGLSASDMKVMHVPERVFHTNTGWLHANASQPLKGKPFADIVAGGYAATYLDEVTHLHWWFYPNEQNNPGWDENNCGRWAGGQGNDEEPYHHKLHKINGVLCFMINDREDQAKFGNDDGGMPKDTRYTLLDKALSSDYAKITIVFDDWEAFAGNSFASSTPNGNADQWHNTIRWAANHPWIEVVNLKDVVTSAQGDLNWVIDHGTNVDNSSLQNYEWLKRASEHSYDNWYYGSGQEQDFFNRVPYTAPDGTLTRWHKKIRRHEHAGNDSARFVGQSRRDAAGKIALARGVDLRRDDLRNRMARRGRQPRPVPNRAIIRSPSSAWTPARPPMRTQRGIRSRAGRLGCTVTHAAWASTPMPPRGCNPSRTARRGRSLSSRRRMWMTICTTNTF